MGKYTEIKSNFVKEKLRKADWKRDKRYIDDLIDIERYVLGKTFGLATGYKIKILEEKYPKEYKNIYKELYVLGKVSRLGMEYIIKILEQKYPREYEEIYKELKLKVWKKIKEEKKKIKKIEKIEEKRLKQELKSLAQKEKEDWIKAGGK